MAMEYRRATVRQSSGTGQLQNREMPRHRMSWQCWYQKAARQKNPTAMFNPGTAYYNGDGVSMADVSAYAWFSLAQDFGSQPAIDAVRRMKEEKGNLEAAAFERVGDMFAKGDHLPQSYSDATAGTVRQSKAAHHPLK
jgi:TPR repeat protein